MSNDKYIGSRDKWHFLFFSLSLSFSFSFIEKQVINHGNLVTGVERLKSIKRGEGKNAKKRGKKFWIYCKSFAKFQRYSVIRKRRVNGHKT